MKEMWSIVPLLYTAKPYWIVVYGIYYKTHQVPFIILYHGEKQFD